MLRPKRVLPPQSFSTENKKKIKLFFKSVSWTCSWGLWFSFKLFFSLKTFWNALFVLSSHDSRGFQPCSCNEQFSIWTLSLSATVKRKWLYALKALCLMAVRCVNTALIFHSCLSSSSLTRQGKTAVTISSTLWTPTRTGKSSHMMRRINSGRTWLDWWAALHE